VGIYGNFMGPGLMAISPLIKIIIMSPLCKEFLLMATVLLIVVGHFYVTGRVKAQSFQYIVTFFPNFWSIIKKVTH
jgi:hypothetical protein